MIFGKKLVSCSRTPVLKVSVVTGELITFAIVSECKGWDKETEMCSEWRNYRHLFPHLPERSRFNRRRRRLMSAINVVRQKVLLELDVALRVT